LKNKKIAIVHDWLYAAGGAEVVLAKLLQMFPKADIYTMVDLLPKKHRDFLEGHQIYTSILQKYSFVAKNHKYFIPIMPYLVEQFDLSQYDLIISDSHFVAKGVITAPKQLHIAYIYSPVRYGWDMYFDYDKAGAFGKGLKNLFMKRWLHKLRIWDFVSAQRADFLISSSKFIQKRVKKYWGRDSTLVYPAIEIDDTIYCEKKQEYFVTLSRLIEYKKIDIMIEAFNELPQKKLIIIGEGRMKEKLQKISKSNITFTGYLPKNEAMEIVSKAKAFIFMAKEDFGIVPIEAQACGTPVIAYADGGAEETILKDKTGVFIEKQDKESLKEAILNFKIENFSPSVCREFAKNFSSFNFEKQLTTILKGITNEI